MPVVLRWSLCRLSVLLDHGNATGEHIERLQCCWFSAQQWLAHQRVGSVCVSFSQLKLHVFPCFSHHCCSLSTNLCGKIGPIFETVVSNPSFLLNVGTWEVFAKLSPRSIEVPGSEITRSERDSRLNHRVFKTNHGRVNVDSWELIYNIINREREMCRVSKLEVAKFGAPMAMVTMPNCLGMVIFVSNIQQWIIMEHSNHQHHPTSTFTSRAHWPLDPWEQWVTPCNPKVWIMNQSFTTWVRAKTPVATGTLSLVNTCSWCSWCSLKTATFGSVHVQRVKPS